MLRIWDEKNKIMVYPNKFSVIVNYKNAELSIKVQDKKHSGLTSTKPMLLTCGKAINGDIYDLDILADKNGNTAIVRFSENKGAYFIHINNKDIIISKNMYDYEIIGNAYETENYDKLFKKNNNEIKDKEEEKDILDKDIIEENKENFKNKNIKNDDLLKNSDKETTNNDKKLENESKKDKKNNKKSLNLEKSIDYPEISIYAFAKEVGDNSFISYIMKSKNLEKFESKSVNLKRMPAEIKAITDALSNLKMKCNVNIYTSNNFLMMPFDKKWIDTWAQNNWKKQNGEDVKNKEIWINLYDELKKHEYKMNYVIPGSSIVEMLRCNDLVEEKVKEGENIDKK